MQNVNDDKTGEPFNLAISTGRDKKERELVYEVLATTIMTHPYVQSKLKHDDPVILCRVKE